MNSIKGNTDIIEFVDKTDINNEATGLAPVISIFAEECVAMAA